MTGTYEMKLNQVAKELYVRVEGTFTEQKAMQFMNDYKRHTGSINPSAYTLRLDSKGLDVVTQQMVPSLEQCFHLYKETGFGKVQIELKNNPVIKLQISRIARQTGLAANILA